MMTCIRNCLLAAVLVAVLATDTQACRRHGSRLCCQPTCCYPCCPPDESPLVPSPAHPGPVTNGTKLTLQNKTYSQAFVIIYLRHPDGIYRAYEKELVDAGTSLHAKSKYYQGDHLLIETWSRGTPTDYWHCHCACLITLSGLTGTFDVIHCH
jgi:hypothetical protein